MPRAVLGVTPFAVLDIETTGIYPGAVDRIIEIAVVRLTADLEIEEEWVTLVNPQRDIGRTDIHGIQAGDVVTAPLFEEVAGDVGVRLDGAVIAGHNLRFDTNFLAHELRRCSISMPTLPMLCTMDLAYRFLPDAPSRKLSCCCEQVAVLHEDDHTALGDARAAAQLLRVLIDRGRRIGRTDLGALGCKPLEVPQPGWLGERGPSGRRLCRSAAAARQKDERSYLARLVERMPGDEARDAREGEYLALVDRVVEDRRVTREEADGLVGAAAGWGMTRRDVMNAHRAYLASLVSQAKADGFVSDTERHDLETVAEVLGLHHAALDVLLSDGQTRCTPSACTTGATSIPAATQATSAPGHGLLGKSVCFTGELSGKFHGERITREMAEQLAVGAGLKVCGSVTKTLDLLVVADPDTQSGKAKKARQYGTRVIAAAAFWRALGIPID
jgi:DNA polymerase-3 subunit epsilon